MSVCLRFLPTAGKLPAEVRIHHGRHFHLPLPSGRKNHNFTHAPFHRKPFYICLGARWPETRYCCTNTSGAFRSVVLVVFYRCVLSYRKRQTGGGVMYGGEDCPHFGNHFCCAVPRLLIFNSHELYVITHMLVIDKV